ncbi:MAG: hypothetical protein HYS17_04785 [Micavibrio aeruginosavorus]|uniref:Uncharacterized protein n=1 Tax=Micavibrio aeruginosavorus TaxID=349221 RepID=A0A7T5R3W9_9BACT|nr:MAG: hypothetical protein HYS17_04785 [Micavibrio aeruginosavorus]
MMTFTNHLLRYVSVTARRKGRLTFSSRDALSLIVLAGLPFVMISSLSINRAMHHNEAYASVMQEGMQQNESERSIRALASQLKSDPAFFLRMNGGQLGDVLSAPGLQRADGDMAVWQYRNHECVIDLFIADQGRGGVIHYEMRDRAKKPVRGAGEPEGFTTVRQRACLKSIIAGHDGIDALRLASR